MLYIYLSNIFYVTGTKITACRALCQKPNSRGCNAELWFSSKAVLLVVCSVKNCLPQVVKDRCPLLKVIPNKSKAAFVFNSAKDIFFFLQRHRRKNFTLCLWNNNDQDSGELPWFFIFLFSPELLSWRNFCFCLFRCMMNMIQEAWCSQTENPEQWQTRTFKTLR